MTNPNERASGATRSAQHPVALLGGLFTGFAAAGPALVTHPVLAPFLVFVVVAVAWFTPHRAAIQFATGAFATLFGVLTLGAVFFLVVLLS
jgi:hypothetical protein